MAIFSIYIHTCPVNIHCHFKCIDRFRPEYRTKATLMVTVKTTIPKYTLQHKYKDARRSQALLLCCCFFLTLTLFDVLSILSGLDSASLNMENRWVCLDVCLCVT